ncbi:hypothetical protein [Mycobacterium sp. E3198]|uniref:hypothetical protein n=1 Tax=Mycobacterium sp. E3198 TaxID=1834143 RepID=UPI000B17A49C|nr:hypothetical protein [Mycobacterium sp. E3198]
MTEPVSFPALESCEELLTDPAEWYYRQIHPQSVNEGIVDIRAFTPSSSDDRKVSGARGSKQDARGAYEEHRRDYPHRETAGTWGVTLAQVLKAKGRLVDDSECPVPAPLTRWPTGHCYLDQRIDDRTTRNKLRLTLAADATRNVCQYPAPDDEQEPSGSQTTSGV